MATNNNGTANAVQSKPTNLSDHYKPVGIQAVSAAAICRPQAPIKATAKR
ncbi:hypothetical protein [Amorphus sp. 3PC139-8]